MAVDAYIKIGNIKGESKDSKHKEWIEVLSWSWGATNASTSQWGGGGGSGKVNVHDITFTKLTDSSSHMLLSSVCRGKPHDDATLVMRKAGDSPLDYITIKLKEVLVTSLSVSGHGSGGEIPMESVSLSFAEFEYSYQPQKKDGSADGGAKEFKYSIQENIHK